MLGSRSILVADSPRWPVDGVGAEEAGVLDELDAGDPLQDGVHLADVDGPAEGPADPGGARPGAGGNSRTGRGRAASSTRAGVASDRARSRATIVMPW